MHAGPAPLSRGPDVWYDWTLRTVPCVYADKYILFDCPGQVELFSHHGSLRNIITQLMKGGKYQVGAWLAHGGACFLLRTVTPAPHNAACSLSSVCHLHCTLQLTAVHLVDIQQCRFVHMCPLSLASLSLASMSLASMSLASMSLASLSPSSHRCAFFCTLFWCFDFMWLMDACARDGARFIAASLLSLATMVRLEMPQVNVISKVDLVEKIGGLRTCQ